MRLLLAGILAALPLLPAPGKVLILTGSMDPSHDWRATTPVLRAALEQAGFEVAVAEKVPGLTAQDLAAYDALVLHYNGPRWGAETERAVEDFIRSGKGMVALHGVSYGAFFGMEFRGGRWQPSSTGDPGWPAYAEMLGATWKTENIGHARRHVFTVRWVDREHPIARGLEETFLADDELYHRMDLKPNARVLATAYSDPAERGTGRDEPVIWAVPFGAGRVVHITLGHDVKSLSRPGFIAAFTRSLAWSAGKKWLRGSIPIPARWRTSRCCSSRPAFCARTFSNCPSPPTCGSRAKKLPSPLNLTHSVQPPCASGPRNPR